MSVSITAVIIGVAFGVLLAAALIFWRQHYRDLFGGFLVLGLLALAVVVTIYQVTQYREQRALSAQIAHAQTPHPGAGSGSSSEPMAKPPVGARILPPLMDGGPRGAAAPAAGNP